MLIYQNFLAVSLLSFLMGTKTMLEDIPAYSVLDFSLQILRSNEKGVGKLQSVGHLGSFW